MTDHAAPIHAKHGLERSPKWERVRKDFLLHSPACAACARLTFLQVHHVLPFHLCVLVAKRPDLELDFRNLIVLCEPPGPVSCHARLGHLGDFRTYNPEIRADSWQSQITPIVYAKNCPKPPVLERMTPADKRAFKALVRRLYGIHPTA